MLKSIVFTFIRIKNPAFSFDPSISTTMLISLATEKSTALLRGLLKAVLHLKRPSALFLGKGVKWKHSSRIFFGKFVQVGDYCHLSALGREGIFLGEKSSIGAFSRLIVSTSYNCIGSYIRIGNNVGIGEYAYLGGGGGLEIGNDCIIGQYLSCHPENHLFDNVSVPIRHQGVTRKGIKIGKNCWIGARVTILDGVTIGDGCVIAAGAVVNKSFPSGCIIGGVPARILKWRVSETAFLTGNDLNEKTPVFG